MLMIRLFALIHSAYGAFYFIATDSCQSNGLRTPLVLSMICPAPRAKSIAGLHFDELDQFRRV